MHENLDSQEVMRIAEKLYYDINPETKMDVPSIAYEKVESLHKYYELCGSGVDFYSFCHARLTPPNDGTEFK